jgi:hypothetical protein
MALPLPNSAEISAIDEGPPLIPCTNLNDRLEHWTERCPFPIAGGKSPRRSISGPEGNLDLLLAEWDFEVHELVSVGVIDSGDD